MVDLAQLEDIGLTHNESVVYVSLLEIGETKTGAIAKKTHLHRVLIYDALESLIQKGLASYCIKENIKYFQAASPKTIVKFIEEKCESVKKLVPSLEILQLNRSSQSVIIFESVRGIKSAILSMLEEINSKSNHVCFGSGNMFDTLGKPFYDLYQQEKAKKKVITRILFDLSFLKNSRSSSITKITKGSIRFTTLGPFPTDTWVYNDKVLIVNYGASIPFAILVTSKDTSSNYLQMFESYWKQSKGK